MKQFKEYILIILLGSFLMGQIPQGYEFIPMKNWPIDIFEQYINPSERVLLKGVAHVDRNFSLADGNKLRTLIYNYGILEESDIFMFQIASQYGNIHACSILMEDLIFENEYNEAHKYELIIAENGTTWDQFQLASKLQRGIALNSKTQLKKALYWYKKCLTMQHDEFEESLLNLKDYRVQAMFSIRHLKLLCPFIIS